MENFKKNGLEKPVEDELHLDELMSVEGGNDTDSDEDDCSIGLQCAYKASASCYTKA